MKSNICVAVQFNSKVDNNRLKLARKRSATTAYLYLSELQWVDCGSPADWLHSYDCQRDGGSTLTCTYRRRRFDNERSDQSGGIIKETGGANETRTCPLTVWLTHITWHVQRASITRHCSAPCRVTVDRIVYSRVFWSRRNHCAPSHYRVFYYCRMR